MRATPHEQGCLRAEIGQVEQRGEGDPTRTPAALVRKGGVRDLTGTDFSSLASYFTDGDTEAQRGSILFLHPSPTYHLPIDRSWPALSLQSSLYLLSVSQPGSPYAVHEAAHGPCLTHCRAQ